MWQEQAARLLAGRRQALGLSVAEAAERTGLTQNCWESWERGDGVELTWESFQLAAQALGAKVEISLTDEASAWQAAFQEGGMDRELRLVSLLKDLAEVAADLSQPVKPSEN